MTTLFEPWLEFNHPLVRQLAFCVASPNLIAKIPQALNVQHSFSLHSPMFWQQQYANYKPRLKQLDQDPEQLIQFMAQLKSTRLGLRFEYLMWFWLTDSDYHTFEIIGHSIQIIDGKHTLGELDFVIRNRDTHAIEHWEVALKFYLAEENLILSEWYGLNRSDTLYRKLNHFTQKQFQFESVNDLKIEQRYAILKGQLYLPSTLHDLTNLPDWIEPTRRLGHWGYELLSGYYRVSRDEWICLHASQSSDTALWWCNGLYHHPVTKHDYMFRQAAKQHHYVRIV